MAKGMLNVVGLRHLWDDGRGRDESQEATA